MSRVEVAKLIKHICMYYPNFKTEDVSKTIDAWLIVLHDKDLHVVLENLAEHVENNVYPPVIANLLKAPKNEITRAIPNLEETRIMLLEMENDREHVATKKEARKYLDATRKTLLEQRGQA